MNPSYYIFNKANRCGEILRQLQAMKIWQKEITAVTTDRPGPGMEFICFCSYR